MGLVILEHFVLESCDHYAVQKPKSHGATMYYRKKTCEQAGSENEASDTMTPIQ